MTVKSVCRECELDLDCVECTITDARCIDCIDGEHSDYDDCLIKVEITNPDTEKLERKGLMCKSHISMYEDDGYIISIT